MSDVLVFNKENDTDDFNHYITEIKKNASIQYCQGKIGPGFVGESLDNCDFIFVHTFNRDIRGFASVNYYSDDNGNEYLYIDLICNSMFHSMTTRGTGDDRRIGGKGMIDRVINLGLEMNVSYIKLSAIDDVIPYYWKLGFRFMNVELEQKAQELVASLRKAQIQAQIQGNDEEVERKLNKIITNYYPGYLNEKTQQRLGELSGSKTEPMRDGGIPMIYYLRPDSTKGGKKVRRRRISNKKTKKQKQKQKQTKKQKQRSMLKKSRRMYKKRKYNSSKKNIHKNKNKY